MPCYVVTPLAGNEVAGRKNPGAGSILTLSTAQAAHPLRLGHLALKTETEPPAEMVRTKPRRRRRK